MAENEADAEQRAGLEKYLRAEREDFLANLSDALRDSMFGDGLEEDYIQDGFEFKGLNNMSDEELIKTAMETGMDVSLYMEEK